MAENTENALAAINRFLSLCVPLAILVIVGIWWYENNRKEPGGSSSGLFGPTPAANPKYPFLGDKKGVRPLDFEKVRKEMEEVSRQIIDEQNKSLERNESFVPRPDGKLTKKGGPSD